MSNAVEFRYFMLNDINVMYFKAEDGYAICVEKNEIRACGKFRLININEDTTELAKALRSQKINITTEEVKEILTKVKIGYFENREVKNLGEQQQPQQAQQQSQPQQPPQQSNTSISLGFMHVGGKTVVEVIKLPASIVIDYPTHSESEDGATEVIQIYDGEVDPRVIRDKYLHGERRYILKTSYDVYVGENLADVVREFRDNDRGIVTTEKKIIEGVVRLLFRNTKEEYGYAYTGFYPDGWQIGFVEYPVKRPQCDPTLIEDFIKWVNTYYNRNKVYVFNNFIMVGAKHFMPAIRMTRVFEDRILINSGPKYLGKSTSQKTIARVYGLSPEDEYVRIIGDNAINTVPRIRNLLTKYLSVPLFFDDIGEPGFKTIAYVLLGAATD